MCKNLLLPCLALVAAFGFLQTASAELIGYWSFDEGSGEIAKDASGNGNDGTLENGTEWTDGQSGYAVQFDGTDDCVNLGNAGSLSITDDFTFSMWVKISEYPTSWRNMLSKLVDDQHVEYNFRYKTATEGQFYYGTGSAAIVCMWNPTEDLPLNTWTHIAGVRKSQTHLKVYFNGVEKRTLSITTQAVSTEADVTIGRQSNNIFYFDGIIDEVAIFSHAMEEAEIHSAMAGLGNRELASKPNPATETVDVPRDTELSWSPGQFASKHDVYLGTSFDAVNTASTADGMGVLVSQGQDAGSYAPEGVLQLGQTYYWRVDEVNAAPDNTVFKGDVWSFTVEPLAYPIDGIQVTAAGADPGAGPDNTINGSGLNADDQHSDNSHDMWLSTSDVLPIWLQYEFDRVYKLHEMRVWNYNVQFEPVLGYGVKDVTIEYSTDGAEWTVLGDFEFAQATALPDYVANTTVDLAGVAARYVRLLINDNWGMFTQYGLSEVRFLQIPTFARGPQPADGATQVDPAAVLSWRSGREAAAHDVYLGTAPDALALIDTVAAAGYAPADLEFGGTYHWRIDEVNEAEIPTMWEGDVWSFATLEYVTIDDFESYNDEDYRIFDIWLDGFVNETGSTVGYFDAPFAERTIVNGGSQSMPLEYVNDAAPFYSEAEYDLGGVDIDTNGADALRLFVAGQTPPFTETADGTILISAIGADIWNAADEFRYAYKTLNGDGSMVARVDSLADSDVWAKGGVMIRETVEPGSAFAAVYMTGDNGIRYQARLEADVDAVSDSTVATAEQIALREPAWVKIERVGNDFNGYYSVDGENWTAMAWNPQTIDMAASVTIGLALTSHNATVATGAAFAGVAEEGGVTGNWQTAEIGVAQPTAPGNDIEPLYVALEDTSGNVAVVTHPNPAAVGISAWQEWLIPYTDLAGINLNRVATMVIGVGDRDNPTPGGAGMIFIDDIAYGKPMPK